MAYDTRYERLIAENYDDLYGVLRDPSGDARFYLELARQSGEPVLELGCGTGRVLLPIARAGIECVGLDTSAAMLEVLARKQPPPHLRLLQGDMRSFRLESRFPLITAPFRAFQHLLDVDAQLEALANVRRHLTEEGLFAFDVFDPKLELMAHPDDVEALGATFTHDGVEVRRYDTVRRDRTRQVSSVAFRFESAREDLSGEACVEMRWFYRYELEHLLVRAGFTRLTFLRDFQGGPWQAGGETVVLARP